VLLLICKYKKHFQVEADDVIGMRAALACHCDEKNIVLVA
jgi:hypothetical protein